MGAIKWINQFAHSDNEVTILKSQTAAVNNIFYL